MKEDSCLNLSLFVIVAAAPPLNPTSCLANTIFITNEYDYMELLLGN